MGTWPEYRMPAPPILTPFHPAALGQLLVGASTAGINNLGACASGAWPVAQKAYYYPFHLSDWATLYKVLLWVGATGGTDNIDVGVYDSQKNRIMAPGPTLLSSTANTVQVIDVTDTELPPGDYLLGVWCSGTTGTIYRTIPASDEAALSLIPIYEEASLVGGLPATAVPVLCTDASPIIVAAGLQLRSVF